MVVHQVNWYFEATSINFLKASWQLVFSVGICRRQISGIKRKLCNDCIMKMPYTRSFNETPSTK